MCQAIYKPSDVTIAQDILRLAWNENPHGAGFAYLEQGRVHISKGFSKFKAFWKAYRQHEKREAIIHFRFATHGSKNELNCHPFEIASDAALIHNGILSKFTPTVGSDISDTRNFISSYLAPALKQSPVKTFATLQAWKPLIESIIGPYNKFAVLTPEGHVLFNEHCGEWHEDVWYSAGYPLDAYLPLAQPPTYLIQGETHVPFELTSVTCDLCFRPLKGTATAMTNPWQLCRDCFETEFDKY